MLTHRIVIAILILSLAIFDQQAHASITKIALSNDDAPGVTGGKFGVISDAVLNEFGQLVFSSQLKTGLGGVDPNDDDGVWVFDGATNSLLVREGSGGVPGLAGASFETFHDFAIDKHGGVLLSSSLKVGPGGITSDSDQGLWKYSGGVGSEIARTGSGNVVDVPGASFQGVSFPATMSTTGQVVYLGFIDVTSEVPSTENQGIWSWTETEHILIAREGVTSPTGAPGAAIDSLADARVNDDEEIIYRALLVNGGSISPLNNLGTWKSSPGGETQILRIGVDQAPGVGSSDFEFIGDPGINNADQIAFRGDLIHDSDVDSTNDIGIWIYTGTTGTLAARTGVGGVPEIPGANFIELNTPLLSDSGKALVEAQLATGPGGVTANDDRGLWMFDGVESSLVARTGSGGVPGLAGASFLEFETLAMNGAGLAAVKATLQMSEVVTSGNDEGLWLLDSEGNGVLVAREGEQMEGLTIAGLSFFGDGGNNDGHPISFNDRNELAFQVDFTNGDSGLFLFSSLSADFDLDGDVDSDDLTDPTLGWEARYGVDLDGSDFLAWQQQYGNGLGAVSSSAAVVPEPTTSLLLGASILSSIQLLRLRGNLSA